MFETLAIPWMLLNLYSELAFFHLFSMLLAKPARAHGLPKIHKTFTNIPKFRPIIDTTGSSHDLVGKYLA